MLTEDVKILFSGFEPSAEVRSKLDLLLTRLHRLAPSHSFFNVSVTLSNGLFEGVIKVSSVAENFVARATDQTIVALGQRLGDGLLDQLERWKALRFRP